MMKRKFFLLLFLTIVFAVQSQTRVEFAEICNGETNPRINIAWVHVHENEQTALNAIKRLPSTMPLCVATWKHLGSRNLKFTQEGKTFEIDPNRIYSTAGVEATLKSLGNYSDSAAIVVKQLGEFFIREYIENRKVVIALHNNTPDGGLHVKSYLPGGPYAGEALDVYVNTRMDKDNFFYTTSPFFFHYLKERDQNVVLQNEETVTDDGSLSVYCGLKGIPYLNIETEHSQVEEQKRMIMLAWYMLEDLGFI